MVNFKLCMGHGYYFHHYCLVLRSYANANKIIHLHQNWAVNSVTRFGDLLDFEQLLKAFGKT